MLLSWLQAVWLTNVYLYIRLKIILFYNELMQMDDLVSVHIHFYKFEYCLQVGTNQGRGPKNDFDS